MGLTRTEARWNKVAGRRENAPVAPTGDHDTTGPSLNDDRRGEICYGVWKLLS